MKLNWSDKRFRVLAIVIAIIGVIVLAWWYFSRRRANKEVIERPSGAIAVMDSEGEENIIDFTHCESSPDDSFPLKLGSCGERVKKVQVWLINVMGKPLKYGKDGKFGPETRDALLEAKNRDNISEEYWNKIGFEKMGV